MIIMFYHSVLIDGLGFFICFKIEILHAQSNKTRFLYVLYCDKTSIFDQSERVQGLYFNNWSKIALNFLFFFFVSQVF